MTRFEDWAVGEKERLIGELKSLGYTDTQIAFMVGIPGDKIEDGA